jgi:type II secretory pathway component PulF
MALHRMRVFKYKAIDAFGSIKRGVFVGEGASDVIQFLERANLSVIFVKKQLVSSLLLLPFVTRIRNLDKDLLVLFKHLSSLLSKQISLADALTLLEAITSKSILKSVIHKIKFDVHCGIDFSQAIGQYRDLFTELIISCLRSAEKSGNIEPAVQTICNILQTRQHLKKTAMKSLLYPIFVFSVLFVLISWFLVFLVSLFSHFIVPC